MEIMDFNKILLNTLENEGGYTVDNGGPTNYGIRQDLYNKYLEKNGLDAKNVTDLKFGDVKKYYSDNYFTNQKIDSLPSDRISGVVFDFGVNAGPQKAIKVLQKVIGSKQDGIIGKNTVKAVNDFVAKNGEDVLLDSINNERANHYYSLVQSDPEQYGKYEKGWVNRLNKIKKQYNF